MHGVLWSAKIDEALLLRNELHAAFGIQLTVSEIIADDHQVLVRYKECGIFAGPFRGKEPSEKSYDLVAMGWFAMEGGFIHRRWRARDSASQTRQMGM